MKETIKNLFKGVTVVVCVIIVAVLTAIITTNNVHNECSVMDYNYQIYRSRVELSMEGVKDRIVTEIDNYIDSIAPESGLNGIRLFELCDKYSVDVRFAMAQAEVESHFGTKGIAAKTNVVWNVKTYDGLSAADMKANGNTFKHPDESIEPYLLLLVNDYFVDGKTEEDMFENFVNFDNKRYASNEKYESMMLGVFNRINNETQLKHLLKEHRRYKMILGS